MLEPLEVRVKNVMNEMDILALIKEEVAREVASERQMWRMALAEILARPASIGLIGAEENDVRTALEPIADVVWRMHELER